MSCKLQGMSAYSLDLRERIVSAVAEGGTHAQVAVRFGVCSKTVGRYVALKTADRLRARPLPGRAPRVSPDQEAALRALVGEDPNRTLAQMSEAWQERTGQFLPRSTFHDAVQRVGARFKKNTRGRGAR